FDPEKKNMGGWYWYAADIKVPTLWDAVHTSGGKVASIGWPVSVGATSIDYDIPEYWRAKIPEDLKLVHALSTPGLPEALQAKSGVNWTGSFSEFPDGDGAKGKLAAAMYALKKPRFFTLHLSSMDETEHLFGPGTPQAKDTLHKVDPWVGSLVAAARRAEPDLVVIVVSDHGFNALEHSVNLVQDFVDAGLMTRGKDGKITDWQAAPWGGASTAIVLKNPSDQAVKARVKTLL